MWTLPFCLLIETCFLSYRGTNICRPTLCRRSLLLEIGTTMTLISSSLSFWKCWRWPDRNFLRCKKRWKSLCARSVCGYRPGTAEDEFRSARRYALLIQKLITDHTSHSAGAGIRASIFNRFNDATVRTREVPPVHVSCDVTTPSRTSSRFTH